MPRADTPQQSVALKLCRGLLNTWHDCLSLLHQQFCLLSQLKRWLCASSDTSSSQRTLPPASQISTTICKMPLWQSFYVRMKTEVIVQNTVQTWVEKVPCNRLTSGRVMRTLDYDFSNSTNSLWCVHLSHPAFTVITNTASILESVCPVQKSVWYISSTTVSNTKLLPEPPMNMHVHHGLPLNDSHNGILALPHKPILHPNPTGNRHILNRT